MPKANKPITLGEIVLTVDGVVGKINGEASTISLYSNSFDYNLRSFFENKNV